MSNLNEIQAQNAKLIKAQLSSPSVQKRIQEMIGRKPDSFITSVLQVVNSNGLLAMSTPESVIGAVYTACALNLPLNNNLGFAYIVPFNNRQAGTQEAQFQLGYKGFIQLAQRSGQIKRIGAVAVYDCDSEDDVKKRLTSLIPREPQGQVIGYAAYLETVTGFEAINVMTVKELKAHALKYSQTYKSAESKGKDYSVWHQQFDAMAKKTVIKGLISKYAPMSVELNRAIESDQGIINQDGEVAYSDNIRDVTPEQQKLTIDDNTFSGLLEQYRSGAIEKSFIDGYALTQEQEQALNV